MNPEDKIGWNEISPSFKDKLAEFIETKLEEHYNSEGFIYQLLETELLSQIDRENSNLNTSISNIIKAFLKEYSKLSSIQSAGNETTPIYTDADGKAHIITSYSGTSKYANKLKIDDLGTQKTPVYFKDGIPVECDFDMSNYATLESPAFTGIPTVPTAKEKDSSAQIANTQFVTSAIENIAKNLPKITIEVADRDYNGWCIKLSNNIIFQGGLAEGKDGTTTVSFRIPFNNNEYYLNVFNPSAPDQINLNDTIVKNKTYFSVNADSVHWFASGM